MYTIIVGRAGLPTIELDFSTEHSLYGYVTSWLFGDEDIVQYLKDDIEYTPHWAV